MKKLLSLVLMICMVFSFNIPTYASGIAWEDVSWDNYPYALMEISSESTKIIRYKERNIEETNISFPNGAIIFEDNDNVYNNVYNNGYKVGNDYIHNYTTSGEIYTYDDTLWRQLIDNTLISSYDYTEICGNTSYLKANCDCGNCVNYYFQSISDINLSAYNYYYILNGADSYQATIFEDILDKDTTDSIFSITGYSRWNISPSGAVHYPISDNSNGVSYTIHSFQSVGIESIETNSEILYTYLLNQNIENVTLTDSFSDLDVYPKNTTNLNINLDKTCDIEVTVPVIATNLDIDVNDYYELGSSFETISQTITNNSIFPITIDLLGATGNENLNIVAEDTYLEWDNISAVDANSKMALGFKVGEDTHWFEAQETQDLTTPEISFDINGMGNTLDYELDIKHGLKIDKSINDTFNIHILIKPME